MKKDRHRRGFVMLAMGILFLLVALGWCVTNVLEDRAAGQYTNQILDKMDSSDEIESVTEDDTNPVVIVEKEAFCGRIIIEKLGVELPVFQNWSYKKLKKAPCRYAGSIETNDVIIAAHNYSSHFGQLKTLENGDKIVFIDAAGEVYYFEMKELALLDGSAVEDMKSGEWDFTLFTCTKGGKQRVTVRCERAVD